MESYTRLSNQDILFLRPIDNDTKIINTQYHCFDNIDFLIEKWSWEAVEGNSIVALCSQLAEMSNDELIDKFIHVIDSSNGVTCYRDDTYVFINYNFSFI